MFSNYLLLGAIVSVIIIAPILWYVGTHLDIRARIWAFGFGKEKPPKILPQPEVHKRIKAWIDQNYHTNAYLKTMGRELVLVDSKTSPTYPNSDQFEACIFTSSEAYMDRRISVSEIPDSELFITTYNFRNGFIDLLPRSYIDMDLTWRDILERFALSKPKEVPTFAEERKMREEMLKSMDIEIGKTEVEKMK